MRPWGPPLQPLSVFHAILLTLLAFLITQAVVVIVGLDMRALALSELLGLGAVLVVGRALAQPGRAWRRVLGTSRVPAASLGWAAILGLALQIPLAELSNLTELLLPTSEAHRRALQELLTPDNLVDALVLGLSLVVLAPMCEELLFRGFILRGLLVRQRPGVAVAVSAALFGLLHVQPALVVPATAAGVLLGMLAYHSGSIWPSMAAHAGINALPLLVPERVVSIKGFNTVQEDVYHVPVWLLAGAGLIAAGAFVRLYRQRWNGRIHSESAHE